MIVNNENQNNDYIITYSNWFQLGDRKFAFRRGELFDITKTPFHIPINKITSCYLINRRHISMKLIKSIIVKEEVKVDVSDLQWYDQEKLNHVFNL